MLWFDEKSIFSVHTICYISVVRALFPLQIHSYDGNLTLKITFDSEEPPSEPAEAIIVGNGITLIWKKPSMLKPINEQVGGTRGYVSHGGKLLCNSNGFSRKNLFTLLLSHTILFFSIW